ncbi:hypothetical protein HWV62_8325 [Athelia sp. TMB]|nr:hypothetical protein HWV62_8325 [Athelia sp. TMB]
MPQAYQGRKGELLKHLEEFTDAKHKLLRQLEDLESQLQATQREFNSLHNLDAPISTFPDEVLAMVFEAADLSSIRASTLAFCLPAFKTLTSLRLTNFFIYDKEEKECSLFRDALMAMPALYHLDLRLSTDMTSFDLPRVFLPTIQFLRIQTHSSTAYEGIVNSIHARSLTTLFLPWLHRSRIAGEVPQVSHFPSLQHLILKNIGGIPSDLGIIYRRFPGVKRLTYQVSKGHVKNNNIRHLLDAISSAAVSCVDHPSTSHSSASLPTLPWPLLDTVAVSALHETNDASQLHEKISKLQDTGYRIRKLKLPKSFIAQSTEAMQRLQGIVDLEEYSSDWPTTAFQR